jgi:LAO/AO transport system kinase
MLKAGILEVGDLFLVNKCELPGADATYSELVWMTQLNKDAGGKIHIPQVIKVSTREKIGLKEMSDAIEGFIGELEQNSLLDERRQKQIEWEMSLFMAQMWKEQVLAPFTSSTIWKEYCGLVSSGKTYTSVAARQLWDVLVKDMTNAEREGVKVRST